MTAEEIFEATPDANWVELDDGGIQGTTYAGWAIALSLVRGRWEYACTGDDRALDDSGVVYTIAQLRDLIEDVGDIDE